MPGIVGSPTPSRARSRGRAHPAKAPTPNREGDPARRQHDCKREPNRRSHPRNRMLPPHKTANRTRHHGRQHSHGSFWLASRFRGSRVIAATGSPRLPHASFHTVSAETAANHHRTSTTQEVLMPTSRSRAGESKAQTRIATRPPQHESVSRSAAECSARRTAVDSRADIHGVSIRDS